MNKEWHRWEKRWEDIQGGSHCKVRGTMVEMQMGCVERIRPTSYLPLRLYLQYHLCDCPVSLLKCSRQQPTETYTLSFSSQFFYSSRGCQDVVCLACITGSNFNDRISTVQGLTAFQLVNLCPGLWRLGHGVWFCCSGTSPFCGLKSAIVRI